jgi:hypothetical protein
MVILLPKVMPSQKGGTARSIRRSLARLALSLYMFGLARSW